MTRIHAQYHVGLKILLERDGKILFLKTATSNLWDFPGGRIDDVEHTVPLVDILAREISEELGPDLKYQLGKPVIHFRRTYKKRIEPKRHEMASADLRSLSEDFRQNIFIVMFEAEYVSGEIVISDEHESLEWLDPKITKFKKEDFLSEEEFEALEDYFKIG